MRRSRSTKRARSVAVPPLSELCCYRCQLDGGGRSGDASSAARRLRARSAPIPNSNCLSFSIWSRSFAASSNSRLRAFLNISFQLLDLADDVRRLQIGSSELAAPSPSLPLLVLAPSRISAAPESRAPSITSVTALVMPRGVMPCSLLKRQLALATTRHLVERALHRARHRIGVQNRAAVQVTSSASNSLNQRVVGPQEAFLVGVENGDQRHLRHVEPSRSRLMPTSTSNLPRRRSRMISMRSTVSMSECR